MERVSRILLVLFAALFGLTLAGCSSGTPASDGEADLITDGELVVAMSGEYRPFSYFDNGELTGFDYDIAQAIADELDLTLVAETAGFSTLVEGTANGRYDLLIASTTATADRAQAVDFANGYYSSGAQLFIGSDAECQDLQDMDNPTLGVATGTTFEAMVKEQGLTTNVKSYDSDITALQDAATGRLYGTITDQLVGQHQINEAGLDLKPCGDRLGTDTQAPAVAKGNPLRADVNEALATIIDNGTYAEISEKYFGKDISSEIDNAPVEEVMANAPKAEGGTGLAKMFAQYAPILLQATGLTLAITAVALVLAIVIGSLIWAMGASSLSPLRWLATGYIGLIRGTPLIAQLFVLYFGLTQFVLLDGFWAGSIALAIHNSAYIAEIIRSGFNSVPHGLVEASRSLGMSRMQAMRKVRIPLATRAILPVLGSQFIIAVKDSSLVAFIGMPELFRTAQKMAAAEYAPLNAYIIVSVFYLAIVLILTLLVHLLEKKLSVEKKDSRS